MRIDRIVYPHATLECNWIYNVEVQLPHKHKHYGNHKTNRVGTAIIGQMRRYQSIINPITLNFDADLPAGCLAGARVDGAGVGARVVGIDVGDGEVVLAVELVPEIGGQGRAAAGPLDRSYGVAGIRAGYRDVPAGDRAHRGSPQPDVRGSFVAGNNGLL